jgi:anthranilate synthase component 1
MAPLFDIAADLDTPVSAWLKLAPLRPRFLLESVEGGERLGRHSFLGFGEAAEIRLPRFSAAAVRDALEGAPRPGPVPEGLPFAGGLVGVTTYGAFGDLEPLAATASGEEPAARYLAPRSLLVFDHLTRSAALLHDGPRTSGARSTARCRRRCGRR